MRVLQIMECTIGGTRRHLRDLVMGLLARGVEVEVACATLRDPRMREDIPRLEAAGARVHEIPMVRRIRPGLDAWHALRLAALICVRVDESNIESLRRAGQLRREQQARRKAAGRDQAK